MKFIDILNLSETHSFTTQDKPIKKGYAGASDIKDGASSIVDKILTGRSGIFFLILALLFLALITRTKPVFIIFIIVLLAGIFHNEIFQWYLYLTKYFGLR